MVQTAQLNEKSFIFVASCLTDEVSIKKCRLHNVTRRTGVSQCAVSRPAINQINKNIYDARKSMQITRTRGTMADVETPLKSLTCIRCWHTHCCQQNGLNSQTIKQLINDVHPYTK